ncbi:hypothetical protein BS17DRAFT_882980 [Gyrodon lividus]|nr:hypothetical protein BS17DRAFT_882980 [Gyrodon lividus]
MFGESDSESPRVPSPWDSLTSAPPTPPRHKEAFTRGIPSLVPEAEEGNVEYKLQLLSPSPARFTRLVTQLKWRLLEGGGQAYYELGVSDSGSLVGLPRLELEESLETLEMMAGEIGASVIIVKEIEVPPELSGLAESHIDRWDGRRKTGGKDLLRMSKDSSPTTSTTEFETELSTTGVTDAEGDNVRYYSPATSLDCKNAAHAFPTALRPSHAPLPPDSALAIFTMDVDEDVANYADSEAPDGLVGDYITGFSVNLEIAYVYKPRPMRKRTTHVASAALTHFDKSGQHMKKKGRKDGHPPSRPTGTSNATGDAVGDTDSHNALPQSKHAKVQLRRDKRDKRRELKRNSLLTHVPTSRPAEPPDDFTHHAPLPPDITDEAVALVSGLESLHVTVDLLTRAASAPSETTSLTDDNGEMGAEADDINPECGSWRAAIIASKEPRLIVEALVVRKLSLDEAFLDFEGFSLH